MMDMLTIEGHDKVLAVGPAFLLPDDKEIAWAGASDHVVNRWDFGWVLGNFLQTEVDGSGSSANRNGHVFDYEQVRKRHPMIRHTPVNMLHRSHHNIGTFVATAMLDPRSGQALVDSRGAALTFPYIEALAGLWRYQCPGEYRAVKDAHDAGHAWFSMEAVPEKFTCLTPGCCGKSYPYKGLQSATYCDSLRKPGSRKRLENPTFVGGAMVIPPARPGWSRAELKQVAGLIEVHPEEAEYVYETLAASAPGLKAGECQDLVLVLLAATFADEDPDIAASVAVNWDAALERLVAEMSPTPTDGKAQQDAVNYRVATEADQRCATCTHFQSTTRSCMLVEGSIDPAGVCDLWQLSDPIMPAGVPPMDAITSTTPIAAGLAVVAKASGRVLMIQRAMDPEDPAAGRWEFPGGNLEAGETPLDGARREWQEEVGCTLPDGQLTGSWTSPNGVYQGFVYVVNSEGDVDCNLEPDNRDVLNPDDPDADNIETAAWWDIAHLPGMPALRSEVRSTDWSQLIAAPDADPLEHDELMLAALDVRLVGDQIAALQALEVAHGSAPAAQQARLRSAAVELAGLVGNASLLPEEWDERSTLYDADYNAAERRQLLKQGKAMPPDPGRYPVGDGERGVQDLKDAIGLVGNGKGSRAAIQQHIIRQAKRLDRMDLIPEDWKA